MWFKRKSTGESSSNVIPESLIAALQVFESDSIVLTPEIGITYASPGNELTGLVRDGRIQSEELLALIRVVRRNHETQIGTIEIPRGPIGEGKRDLRVVIAQISDSGWILVLVRDESEIERVAQVRRDFVANISHELKTPIGAISLLSEALLGAKDDPVAVAQFASRMQSEAKRLTDLVQEIINLSKVQDSDPLKEAQTFGVEEVIREAVTQCKISAEARHISITIGEVDKVKISGDREQIIMALHNLIENAINYSPENTKVSITTALEEGATSQGVIGISVTDQGIGIPETSLERIFERFYRVDPARSRQTGGTGLGLSIVKNIAIKHGGEIKVWSAENVGSRFELRLPISRLEQVE